MSDEARVPIDKSAHVANYVLDRWQSDEHDWDKTIFKLNDELEQAKASYEMALRLRSAITGAGGQLPLIPDSVPEPKKPRKPRRVLMHDDGAGHFVCKTCDVSESFASETTEAARKRGIPCPVCNATEDAKE